MMSRSSARNSCAAKRPLMTITYCCRLWAQERAYYMRTHTSPLGRHNPTYCGHRRQITNGRRTISQLQIAECSNGRACCLFNLLNLVGGDQHHHDLDVALVKGGTHPCLHKLATTRPTPHPKVISLIDGGRGKEYDTWTTRRWTWALPKKKRSVIY